MRTLRKAGLAGLSALALAACQPPADARPAPEPAAAPGAPATPETPASPASESARAVRLETDGLTIQDTQLSFGTAEAAVIQRIATLRGAQPARDANAECGAGPLEFADWGDGLRLAFQDGRLAGWWADDQAPATYATEGGLRVGSTLAQVRAALPGVQVTEATIGPEFAADGLFGTLSGASEDARVTALWAGVSCVFR